MALFLTQRTTTAKKKPGERRTDQEFQRRRNSSASMARSPLSWRVTTVLIAALLFGAAGSAQVRWRVSEKIDVFSTIHVHCARRSGYAESDSFWSSSTSLFCFVRRGKPRFLRQMTSTAFETRSGLEFGKRGGRACLLRARKFEMKAATPLALPSVFFRLLAALPCRFLSFDFFPFSFPALFRSHSLPLPLSSSPPLSRT